MMAEKQADQPRGIFRNMPSWEKTTWTLIVVYIIIVLVVFWFLGWKNLPFP